MNRGGFGHVEAVVEGLDRHRGHLVRVLAKNENYLVRYLEIDGDELTDGAVLACTPDIICVVDSDTGWLGMHAALIYLCGGLRHRLAGAAVLIY